MYINHRISWRSLGMTLNMEYPRDKWFPFLYEPVVTNTGNTAPLLGDLLQPTRCSRKKRINESLTYWSWWFDLVQDAVFTTVGVYWLRMVDSLSRCLWSVEVFDLLMVLLVCDLSVRVFSVNEISFPSNAVDRDGNVLEVGASPNCCIFIIILIVLLYSFLSLFPCSMEIGPTFSWVHNIFSETEKLYINFWVGKQVVSLGLFWIWYPINKNKRISNKHNGSSSLVTLWHLQNIHFHMHTSSFQRLDT